MKSTQHLLAAVAVALALCGCSGKVIEGKKIDYKSAGKGKELNVPADLSVPPSSDRYNVPEASFGSATYSEYTEDQANKPGEPSTAAVLPVHRMSGEGPLIHEEYAITPHGIVQVTMTDLETGYQRAYPVGG